MDNISIHGSYLQGQILTAINDLISLSLHAVMLRSDINLI